MKLRLFDTFSRQVREFEPINPPQVGLYACGPTVYHYSHLGNYRTYIFEDILRRVLEFNGYRVKHVINITDVGHLVSDADSGEDKMEKGSRRTGKTAWEIAEFYTQAFKDDFQQLNILKPAIWCKATDHIGEQIEFIQCIEAKGLTYRTSDGVYFDTSGVDDYGYLARLNLEGLEAGKRVDLAEKKSPTDFALWKFSPENEQRQMEWKSPWGVGFPGWHIECSAMAAKFLGPLFDIHCGGEDHIPVHHTNEIAQTQACYGTNLANFWMHGYFLQVGDLKMSKSADDFLRIQTVLDRGYDPLAYRYYCLNSLYRSKLNFRWQGMDGATTSLNRLRKLVHGWGETAPTPLTGNSRTRGQAISPDAAPLDKFTAQVNDDLNMPRALAVTWELAKGDLPDGVKKATIREFDRVLGLDLMGWAPQETAVPSEIMQLVQQRQTARAEKRWQEADGLRDQIVAAGYSVKDTANGAQIIKL